MKIGNAFIYLGSSTQWLLSQKVMTNFTVGRGGGQVVSMLTFYSDDPSSNPTEAYSFFCKMCVWKERK